jgi:serine O-acetyltransferase
MSLLVLRRIKEDIDAVFERDPAARTGLEVFFTYPGLHAIWGYRIAHWLWTHHFKFFGRLVSHFVRWMTGIEIHPGARICSSFFIDHGMGVVIGETAEIGCNVTMYHGVTLGGVSLEKGKRHPTIKDNVVIGAGAKILGAITVGENSRIGANAVVVKDVPPDSVVVGVPGQIVVRKHQPGAKPDLQHDMLPDAIGTAITAVMKRLEMVEKKVSHLEAKQNGNGYHPEEERLPGIHAPEEGYWQGEDFMI